MLKTIYKTYLNWQLNKCIKLQEKLKNSINTTIEETKKALALREKQLALESKRLQHITENKEYLEMPDEEFSYFLKSVRSPFTTNHERYIDDLENKIDSEIKKLSIILTTKNNLIYNLNKIKTNENTTN